MAYKRKTWHEKLRNGHPEKLERVEKKFGDKTEGALMYIATPDIVDTYIRNIPEGVHTSLQQMRKDLAAAHHADFCCPITAGIFLRIVAEAAYEDYLAGKPMEEITPFWRMIDGKAPIAKKLTFGPQFVTEQRTKEHLPY